MNGGIRLQGFIKKGLPNLPLVSVIITVFNGEKYIKQAIDSVINQSYKNVELIIVDGGSKDKTLEIIKINNNKIDYWISEPDRGVYHGMNKGVLVAKGQYIGFLGADDWYEKDAIKESIKLLLNGRYDYSYGKIRIYDNHGAVLTVMSPVSEKKLENQMYLEMAIPHQSMFTKREVFASCGLFDESFRIAGDQDFVIRMHKQGFRGFDTKKVIANYRLGGISDSLKAIRESKNIAIKYGRNKYSVYYMFGYRSLRHIMIKTIPKPVIRKLANIGFGRHGSQ